MSNPSEQYFLAQHNDNNQIPQGWKRTEKTRRSGRTDVTFNSPNGSEIRSKKQMLKYIEENNLSYTINNFNFQKTGNPTHEKNINTSKNQNEINGEPEVSVVNEDLELSQYFTDLSESCVQLKYERDKKEESLVLLKKEADEIILKCESEIKKLTNENLALSKEIKLKENEIVRLKNCTGVDKVKVTETSDATKIICKDCKVYKCDLLKLKCRIQDLIKEKTQLMETILPCPLPDVKLLKEIQEKNNIIKKLTEDANSNQTNLKEIENILQSDFDKILSENQKLKEENIQFRITCEELLYENSKIVGKKCKNDCITLKETKIVLKNRFDMLTQLENNTESDFESHQSENKSVYEEILETQKTTIQNKTKIVHPRKHTTTQGQLKTNKNKSKKTRDEVLILADSHGRNISEYLMEIWPSKKTQINSIFKRNANFDEVTKDLKKLVKLFGKNDYVVVIGGANDSLGDSEGQLLSSFKQVIEATRHTNLILAALPYRYHTPELNSRVSFMNMEIEGLVKKSKHATLLTLNYLTRQLHTKHGLHLNKQGKRKVASMIKDIILPSIKSYTTTSLQENKIQVVEEDMKLTIDNYRNDPTIAFAHSISADLQDDRNMSAGVAVVFRKSFGKPKPADYVHNKLTCQELKEGAKIYSLVTKPVYWGKPNRTDYDEAFLQLASHFKEKKLKTLICSPIGCVRDLVQPNHFITNLVKFQKLTEACVKIICYKQNANRILRNGLSHPAFVKQLKDEIKKYETPSIMYRSLIQAFTPRESTLATCIASKSLEADVVTNCHSTPGRETLTSFGERGNTDKKNKADPTIPNVQDMGIFPPLPPPSHQGLLNSQENSVVDLCQKQSITLHTDINTHLSDQVSILEDSRLLSKTPVSDNDGKCDDSVSSLSLASGSDSQMSQINFL